MRYESKSRLLEELANAKKCYHEQHQILANPSLQSLEMLAEMQVLLSITIEKVNQKQSEAGELLAALDTLFRKTQHEANPQPG